MIEVSSLFISSDWHIRLDKLTPAVPDISNLISYSTSYYSLYQLIIESIKSTVAPSLCICGGDIFDKPLLSEPVSAIVFKKLLKNINFAYVLGQHDYKPSFGEYNFIQGLIENSIHLSLSEPLPVKLTDSQGNLDIEIEIYGSDHLKSFEELIKQIRSIPASDQPTVFIFHQIWNEFGSHFLSDVLLETVSLFRPRSICFSGDLHKKKIYSIETASGKKYRLYTTSCLYPVTSNDLLSNVEDYGYYFVIRNKAGKLVLEAKYVINPLVFILHSDYYSTSEKVSELLTTIKNNINPYLPALTPFVIVRDPQILNKFPYLFTELSALLPQERLRVIYHSPADKEENLEVEYPELLEAKCFTEQSINNTKVSEIIMKLLGSNKKCWEFFKDIFVVVDIPGTMEEKELIIKTKIKDLFDKELKETFTQISQISS